MRSGCKTAGGLQARRFAKEVKGWGRKGANGVALNTLMGYPIRVSEYAVEKKKRQVEVKRTWRERLLTWPWRPGQATKTITEEFEIPAVLLVHPVAGTSSSGPFVLVHPAVFNTLKQKQEQGAWKTAR